GVIYNMCSFWVSNPEGWKAPPIHVNHASNLFRKLREGVEGMDSINTMAKGCQFISWLVCFPVTVVNVKSIIFH
ncbi:hypothetical protein A4A49_59648, partial [Nicotiana attenuata]